MSGPIISCAQTTDDDVQIDQSVICVVCNKTDKLLRCSRCKVVFYCTKEHQRRDWKRHKEFCTKHPAHSAATDQETFSPTNKNFNRETTKQYLSNHKLPKSSVSNLNKISVADISWGTNVTSVPYQNTKHFAGNLYLNIL